MSLVKAVVVGVVGALAIPWAIQGGSGELVDFLQYGIVHLNLGTWHFAWSWPIFCVLTLFTWIMLKWAGDG